jgi:hypothetical protein
VNSPLEALSTALDKGASTEGMIWLREGLEELTSSERPADVLARRFPAALRRLGREPLGVPLQLTTSCGVLSAANWPKGDAGRACLMLRALASQAVDATELANTLFRQGDEGERAAVVRILCLLPAPCTLRRLALEAGRINSLILFAALALDNPYPCACFDDHQFNQVVVKSFFNGLSVVRIIGLSTRANPELAQMCEDYIRERQAAGRALPADIWLALEPHASPAGFALLLTHLEHPEPTHRHFSALALNRAMAAGRRRDDPRVNALLAERREVETDPDVRRALAAEPQIDPATINGDHN